MTVMKPPVSADSRVAGLGDDFGLTLIFDLRHHVVLSPVESGWG